MAKLCWTGTFWIFFSVLFGVWITFTNHFHSHAASNSTSLRHSSIDGRSPAWDRRSEIVSALSYKKTLSLTVKSCETPTVIVCAPLLPINPPMSGTKRRKTRSSVAVDVCGRCETNTTAKNFYTFDCNDRHKICSTCVAHLGGQFEECCVCEPELY